MSTRETVFVLFVQTVKEKAQELGYLITEIKTEKTPQNIITPAKMSQNLRQKETHTLSGGGKPSQKRMPTRKRTDVQISCKPPQNGYLKVKQKKSLTTIGCRKT